MKILLLLFLSFTALGEIRYPFENAELLKAAKKHLRELNIATDIGNKLHPLMKVSSDDPETKELFMVIVTKEVNGKDKPQYLLGINRKGRVQPIDKENDILTSLKAYDRTIPNIQLWECDEIFSGVIMKAKQDRGIIYLKAESWDEDLGTAKMSLTYNTDAKSKKYKPENLKTVHFDLIQSERFEFLYEGSNEVINHMFFKVAKLPIIGKIYGVEKIIINP